MKNTTFRKKALLSSVAMLLVALVALGSATFAWFTANPNANASGLVMKTTASTGLLIRTETDARWTHDAILRTDPATVGTETVATLGTAFNLQPVSHDQAQNGGFWKIAAEAAGSHEAKAKTNMEPASDDVDYYSEKIYFRLSDGSEVDENLDVYLTNITFDVDADANLKNAIRVALVKKDGTLIGTYAPYITTANGVLVATSVDNTTPKAGSYTSLTTAVTENVLVANGADLQAVANTDDYITMYVYLDGQDTTCYSENVNDTDATKILNGVSIDFTLAPAAQG